MPGYQNNATGGTMPYAVGKRVYGGSRSYPTIGPVSKRGYIERDIRYKARREAVERRLKAKASGRQINPDAMRRV